MPTFTIIVTTPTREGMALDQQVARSAHAALVKWAGRLTDEEAQQMYGFPSLAHLQRAAAEQRPFGSLRGLWVATLECGSQRLHVAAVRTSNPVTTSPRTRSVQP